MQFSLQDSSSATPSPAAAAATVLPPPSSPPAAAAAATATPEIDPSLLDFDINPALTSEQKTIMHEMLARLKQVFSTNPLKTPTSAPGVEHEIHLTDPVPIKQKAYRLPLTKKQVVSETVKKLQAQHLVVPSNSPWSSPVVLVPKQGGSWRMCIDYRKVNAKTRKDAYPIPLIEDCLNMCKDAKWLTLIDVKDAYHHISMSPQSQAVTAFVTPDGLFEWLRMPFGLCNAPATFQRYVDGWLRDLIGKTCAAFFDDCLVFSSGTFEDHVEKVEAVLKRLSEAGLEINYKKCRFGYTELLFVGHLVSGGTIKPDPAKLSAVRDFPTPTNVTGVKSFLGLTNYYHKFIRGFAMKARPLYALTRKGTPFEWSQAAQFAFQQLKDALLSAPCLHAPDFKRPFILQTDASGEGLSGVLTQSYDDGEHPVAYISRQLNKAEQNYSATEWECLAVVWAVGQYEPYLIEAPFTVVTDHSALQWLATKRFENTRLMRWAMKLQEFSYTVVHRSGTANANADALSRNPIPNSAPPERDAASDDGVPGITPGTYQAHFIRTIHLDHCPFPNLPHATRQVHAVQKRKSTGATKNTTATPSPAAPSTSAVSPSVGGNSAARPDDFYDFTVVDTSQLGKLIDVQHASQPWKNIIAYLERKEVPASFDSIAKRRLERDSADYQLLPVISTSKHPHGLYYLPARPRRGLSSVIPIIPRLVIPDTHFRRGLIQMFHDTPMGGHFGVKRTFRKLYCQYYWPSLLKDVENHVAQCQECHREKVRRRTLSTPAGIIAPPTVPFELISIDFVGPLTTSEDARFVLVVIDHFTQWVIAIPTQGRTAAVVARALVEEVFCRYGVPKRILSDRGSEFRSEMIQQIHQTLHVKQLFTSSNHPQCNGKVERTNATLKEIIFALHGEFKGQWIQSLQLATFAYNTSVSEVTLHTPFFLLYGREALTLGDIIGSEASDEPETASRDAYADLLRSNMLTSHSFVRSILDNKVLEINKQRMARTRIPVYHLGDLVYLQDHRHAHSTGDERAHVRPFTGPWQVLARLGETTYTLKPLTGSNAHHPTTVHISRMKPWHGKPANSSPPAEVPFEIPVSNGPIRIPSSRSYTGLGAVDPDDALHLSANPQEVRKAEKAILEEEESPSQGGADGTAPIPTTATQPTVGPAAAATAHHRHGYRPNYNESARAPMEPRPSARFSLAPRSGLAPDAPTSGSKKKPRKKRKSSAS